MVILQSVNVFVCFTRGVIHLPLEGLSCFVLDQWILEISTSSACSESRWHTVKHFKLYILDKLNSLFSEILTSPTGTFLTLLVHFYSSASEASPNVWMPCPHAFFSGWKGENAHVTLPGPCWESDLLRGLRNFSQQLSNKMLWILCPCRNSVMFNNEMMADVHFVVGPPGGTQRVPGHKVIPWSRTWFFVP